MRLRSVSQITEDLGFIREMIDLLEARTDLTPTDRVVLDQHRQMLAETSAELALSDERGLQVVLDGRGVDGHAISTERLIEFLDPLQASLRGAASDELRDEGGSFGPTARQLATPTLRSLFDGSVGMKFTGPIAPLSGEQLDMLRPTMFDRAVERVLAVLETATDPDIDDTVLEATSGLTLNTIAALRRLTEGFSKAGAPTRIAWRGTLVPAERLLTLTPGQAKSLFDALSTVEPRQVVEVVSGHLAHVDDHDGTFHLQADDGSDFYGRVADGVMSAAKGVVYTQVTVSLEVHTAESQLKRSKPKYVLAEILR